MSLPINVKFEVPKCKAPPPTKTSLWPSLKPAPKGGEKVEAGKACRPITTEGLSQFKARDGRSRKRGLFQGRKSLMKFAIPAIPVLGLAALLGLDAPTKRRNSRPRRWTSAAVPTRRPPRRPRAAAAGHDRASRLRRRDRSPSPRARPPRRWRRSKPILLHRPRPRRRATPCRKATRYSASPSRSMATVTSGRRSPTPTRG